VAVLTSISTFKQSLTGGAFEALAAVSGDSLNIISFPDGSRAYVEEIITGNSAHKMEVSVASPRFGDITYGLRQQHQFNPTLSRLQADQDYAILGYTTDQPLTCLRLYGPDTGFYKIPMPGHWNSRITGGWFIASGQGRQRPHIPVINSQNAGNTYLDALSSNNAGATKVSLLVAQLNTRFPG
jgi:hypothetical protein